MTAASYELRSLYRATPFGLFAGVGAATVNGSGDFQLPGDPAAYLRPDCEWLDGLITELESSPSVLKNLGIGLRYPFSVHGDRVYRPAPTSVDEGFARSVLYTETVRGIIVALIEGPCRVDELLERLQLPELPDPDPFSAYLAQLVAGGFLVTSLRPASSSETPLIDMATVLREAHPGIARVLTDLHSQMGLVGMEQVDERLACVRTRAGKIRSGTAADAAIVQVDTAFQRPATVPAALLGDAMRFAGVLDRIAVKTEMATPLRAWHHAFVERFGVDRAVPVLVATDPVGGVGLPRWSAGQDDEPTDPAHQRRCQALLSRARDDDGAGERRVAVLEDSDLPVDDGTNSHPGRDMCFDVYFADDGRYVLAPAVVGGAAVPGAFNGRLRAAVDAVTDSAATADLLTVAEGAARVLDFRTPRARAGNVNRPANLHQAAVAIDHLPTEPGDLTPTDIAVLATLDGVALYDGEGAPVALSFTALLNRDTSMSGLVRLLLEIEESRRARWVPWTWGPFAALPSTPRVVCDGVIVCRAQWAVPDSLREPVGAAGFASAVARWREQAGVPRLVQASGGTDQVLPLDLADDPVHLEILRKMLRAGGPVMVREDLLSVFEQEWGRAHHMEVVLTIAGDKASTCSTPAGPT